MATYRIGIGSFNLKDGAVGLGTESSGLGNLKVEGTVKTTDLDVTGVSTFTRYAGFVADDLNIVRDTSLTGEHSSTGDIVVGLNSTFTVSTGATVTVGTVESVSIGTHFSPPTGGVEDRPEDPVEGTVRFNRDLNTLEFYNGIEWRQFTVNGGGGRAIFFGGYNTNPHGDAYGKHIDYMNLTSGGDAIFFGDLYQKRTNCLACGNKVRSLCTRGYSIGDDIDYVNIQSTGNGIDFGDSTVDTYGGQGVSSSTRGIFVGGAGTNIIDYVEIMTTGNAQDFGDAGVRSYYRAAMQSPVRAVLAGGYGNYGEQMAYNSGMITFMMASKGNSTGWGDTTDSHHDNVNGGSNHVRGIYALGADSASPYGMEGAIDYTILATGGNATSFGELTHHVSRPGASASNIRVVIAGGRNTGDSTKYTEIDSILIASTGGGTSFADLTVARDQFGGTSDCHGGLGGY